VSGGFIYISSDFGSTWTSKDSSRQWTSNAMSASGQYQIATVDSNYIYISSDFGNTWKQDTSIGSVKLWTSVCCSASGQYQTGVCNSTGIYRSTNFGSTWSLVNSVASNFQAVKMSASGQYQTAVASNVSNAYVSSDYGNTWSTIGTLNTSCTCVAMSGSGQIQIVTTGTGNVYASTNFGQSWGTAFSITSSSFSGVAISASGQYVTIAKDTAGLYTCVNSPAGYGVITVGNYAGTASGVTGVAGSLFYDTSFAIAGASSLRISTGSTWMNVKSFVIDHPIDTSKYLVHGCLEGPEAGVYYRGKGEIMDGISLTIELPLYVNKLAKNLSIQISAIYDGGELKTYNVSTVNDNKFTVYGPNGKFYWIVHGSRAEIDVEPSKHNTIVKGNGPYKWI
jgi:hypothetical protein